MADQEMRPASNEQAPNPAHSYERADPKREPGQGRMDNTTGSPPEDQADKGQQAVKNRQNPTRQINAQDTDRPEQPDHSMLDEEPLGADQRPIESTDQKNRRQPRTGGKGGTPDAGEPRRNG